ncbi:phage terminase small subunit [Clostridium sp. OS1-26]|uniref:phage terminase small subunit n=1 Tax=Clostridium sp. OS1-26 TaxID=3070681 RepID=UPI0027E180EA|nr:phage terminase small subunit [Clostridium sp. OS1-26]WML33196.1 phage terminase small subunit [Clostridium sp. OS1-26]
MARVRSPDRDKAYEIYKEHAGGIDLVKIADILNLSPGTIRGWKNKDKWNDKLNVTFQKNTERSKRKKGAPKGNKNSVGHASSVPKGNKNAETHGFFSKYLPEETLEIMQEIEQKNPLDILWENIIIQYAAIIRAQRIMHVTEKEEIIKELKRSKVKTNSKRTEKTSSNSSEEEYEYEFQFAWDRQATFLHAQSRAMAELRGLIRQYDELLNANRELATEEQKLRIEKLKVDIAASNKETLDNELKIVVDYGDENGNS